MVADVETDLRALTRRMRRHIVEMVYGAKSGHIGGSLSSTDILAVLYSKILKHDPERPDWPERDRFIMSKGHAAPLLYAVLAKAGYFDRQLLWDLRQVDSQGDRITKAALRI